MSQISAGARAPDFELKTVDGQSRRLSDALQRGPVVLAFYKSACPVCQFTFPYIQKIFEQVGKRAGWTLWGVSQDEQDETRRFAGERGITFDLLIDEYPYAVSAAYGLEFVPALFLIQPDGTVALSESGFTKPGLNQIAGFEFFTSSDSLPVRRPG